MNKALRAWLKENNISTHKLNDAIRKGLSEKSRLIHPKLRADVIKIASPKTVVYKWWQKIKAKMYDSSDKQPDKKRLGRPRTDKEISELILFSLPEKTAPSYTSIKSDVNLWYKKHCL